MKPVGSCTSTRSRHWPNPCDINALGADFMTLSGHKIGAPKGVGALIKRSESLHLDPLIKGGGQERGARAGT